MADAHKGNRCPPPCSIPAAHGPRAVGVSMSPAPRKG